jgi:serine/threonine protein kinase/Tfp pilus assembly protein PilF
MEHPKIIDGQFKVVDILGEGLSGNVYKVQRGREIWALKLLKAGPELSEADTWIDAFKFEFSLLKDIDHPHVVRIGDFGYDRELNRLYFTEELVEGVTLDKFLADHDAKNAEELLIQALEGLEAIHASQALHGDIKPSNMYVQSQEGRPWLKILDLGIAHPHFRLSAGSPSYFAPEKIHQDPIDERADLYSLAVTFYICLTGKNPFKRATVDETLRAHTSVVPPHPGSLNPAIPPYLNRILMRLLEKNPLDRFRNAGEVLGELDLEREQSSYHQLKAPAVTEKWIGRENSRQQVRQWVDGLRSFSILLLSGEPGIGKSRLLEEVKYELELDGHTIRSLHENTVKETIKFKNASRALYLYDIPEKSIGNIEQLIGALRARAEALIMTAGVSVESEIIKICKDSNLPCTVVTIGSFTREDVAKLISLSSHGMKAPNDFVERLFDETQGHPRHTVHLLSTLSHENKLVGLHGQWNFTLLREADLEQIFEEAKPDVADDILSHLGEDQAAERSRLLISRIKKDLRLKRKDRIKGDLIESEALLKSLPFGRERLTLRAQFLEAQGWNSILRGQFDQARTTLEAARTVAEEIDDQPNPLNLRVRNLIAYVLSQQGKVDEAIEIFKKTHQVWKDDLEPQYQHDVLNNDLGTALMMNENYSDAIRVFNENLQFFEELEDPSHQNRCLYHLGECTFRKGNLEKAIDYYQQCADRSRRHRQWDFLLRAYNGLGNTYHHLSNIDSSIENYQRALDLALFLKDYTAAAAVAQNMGVIQKEQDQAEHAEYNLDRSIKMLRRIKETTPYILHLMARARLELGELKRKQKDFSSAHQLINEAKQLAIREESLKHFFFWTLLAQAELALDEGRLDEFADLYPELNHHAKSEQQIKLCEEIKKRSPVDPTVARADGIPLTEHLISSTASPGDAHNTQTIPLKKDRTTRLFNKKEDES